VLLSLSLLVKKEENLGVGGKKAGKATMGLAKNIGRQGTMVLTKERERAATRRSRTGREHNAASTINNQQYFLVVVVVVIVFVMMVVVSSSS
jgi:hypothetical protein